MSKPFILCNRKGLSALPHWLKRQSFDVYSVAFGPKGLSISLGEGEGRQYRRTQGIAITDPDLLDPAEEIVRKHLGWKTKA